MTYRKKKKKIDVLLCAELKELRQVFCLLLTVVYVNSPEGMVS